MVSRPRSSMASLLIFALFALPVGPRPIHGQEGDEALDALLRKPDDVENPSPEESRGRETGVRSESGSVEKAAPTETGRQPVRGRSERSVTPRKRVIEEIVVTAQKQEEALQDVPISMSVLNADFLRQHDIGDLANLGRYVPNASFAFNGVFIEPRIRGFSAEPLNRGFEQPVGFVVDGIPYGRAGYFQAALLDLERVEVLRGPQGTLFGKNTTVGLLSLVTNKPSEELAGFIDAELGELGRRRFEGAVGGPLIPGVMNVRIAGLLGERDGYVENTTARFVPTADERMGGSEAKGLRFQTELPDLLGANLLFSFERSTFDQTGIGFEFKIIPERTRAYFRQFDPDTDFEPGNFVASIDFPERFSREITTFLAQASYPLAGWSIDLVSGWSELESVDAFDGDISPAPAALVDFRESSPQTTFELRTTSPMLSGLLGLGNLAGVPLGSSEVIAGIFYQRRLLTDANFRVTLNPPVLVGLIAADTAPADAPVDPPPFIGMVDASGAEETSSMFYDQTSDAVAGFGQMSWHLTPRWSFVPGLRISHERKTADWDHQLIPVTAPVFRALQSAEEFTRSLSRNELRFSPKAAVRYAWSDDIGIFASWAQAFRAGGFNTVVFQDDPVNMEFDTEYVDSWELGTKLRLLGGAATSNLGLFRMTLTDFQVRTSHPGVLPTPTVVNAGEALSQGVEGDLTWLPTTWLSLVGALGFNDTEFIEFPFGGCAADREDSDGDGDPRCDLSGEPLPMAPKWTATLASDVRVPLTLRWLGDVGGLLTDGIEVVGGLTVEYQDTQFLRDILDPRTRQGSFFYLDGRLGLSDAVRGWEIGITVENLTDRVISSKYDIVPGAAGHFVHTTRPPRIVFGGIRWTF